LSKRTRKMIIAFLLILIIIFLIIKVFKIQDIILKKIYPKDYSEYVYKYSNENNLDPLLMFAIIKAESNFKPDVISKSNAVGLMQLMDSTAEETAKKMNIEYDSSILYEPEKNILLGTKYYSLQYQKYGNITVALMAYNAGSGNVDKWIEKEIIEKNGGDAENIPFKETNNYVRRILRDYEIYKELYND